MQSRRRPALKPIGPLVSILLLLMPLTAANAGDVTTRIKHKQPAHFIPDHRIRLEAAVTDPSGVDRVRCYFKTAAQADHLFVEMADNGAGVFSGVLPAPGPETEQIDYLFLVVNKDNVVVKTQSHAVQQGTGKALPAWQEEPSSGDRIDLYSEVSDSREQIAGFNDAIALDAVESSLRFGVVAGIYVGGESAAAGSGAATAAGSGAAASGGAAAGAATAVAGGTVATATGISTGTIVAASAVAVAAVGAGAAASDSGGSDDSGSSPPSADPSAGCDAYAGTYSGSATDNFCTGAVSSGPLTFIINPDCTGQACTATGCDSLFLNFSGSTFTTASAGSEECGPDTISGTVSGNTISGTFSHALGGGGTYQVSK
jgi:hypothetical protein